MLHANQSAPARRLSATSSQVSALDRAIVAAEAYLPEYQRLSDAHGVAEEGLPRWDTALNERVQAARAAIPMPSELCFVVAPADQLMKVETTYADGSVRTFDQVRQGYSPDNRESLAKHCSEKGLDAAEYLAIWDDWKAQQDGAADAARGPKARAAVAAYEKAEEDWEGALTKRRRLATAILQAPINSPEEAIAQIEAYRRIEEVKDLSDAFEEDKTMLLEAALRALASLTGSPEPHRLAA